MQHIRISEGEAINFHVKTRQERIGYRCDLGNALGGHIRLVEENSPEMVPIREHLSVRRVRCGYGLCKILVGGF